MSIESRLSDLVIQRWSLGERWNALNAPAREGGDWGLLFPSEIYGKLFDRSFPQIAKNAWKPLRGSYGTFFKRISDADLEAVRAFVDVLRPAVVISDLTDGSLALGFRARKSGTAGPERTELGQLMRDAKPYDVAPAASHRKAGTELAKRLATFFDAMPLFSVVDGFVAVPPSDPAKKFSLPRGFAAHLAKHADKTDFSAAVIKHSATPQLKNLPRHEKVAALLNSVSVDASKVAGKAIVVVDDLYQSGLTLNYITEKLREAGAATVYGLVAVKTMRDDDNVPKQTADDWDADDDF